MSDEGEKSSWLEPLPEEYATEGDVTGRRMLIATLTVIILAIFGGLIWYSYLEGNKGGPVPVVRADKSVVKEKPDTPGGLQVPDQDKRVFSRVASGQSEHDEKLSPSAELPIERPTEKPADSPVVVKVAETAEAPANVTRKLAVSSPAKDVKIGNFLVQLGAFGKKETAEQLWNKLQKDNLALLGSVEPDIMMIDLGKKGVLYRLRGGMITNRASAEKICDTLKAKKQACIVVTK